MLTHGDHIGKPELGEILRLVAVDSRGGNLDADDWMPDVYYM